MLQISPHPGRAGCVSGSMFIKKKDEITQTVIVSCFTLIELFCLKYVTCTYSDGQTVWRQTHNDTFQPTNIKECARPAGQMCVNDWGISFVCVWEYLDFFLCVSPSLSLPGKCSVWSGPVQTTRADSCLDWAGASRPLTSLQQRQVSAVSWQPSHSPLTTPRHTTVNPSLPSRRELVAPACCSGIKTFHPLVFLNYTMVTKAGPHDFQRKTRTRREREH